MIIIIIYNFLKLNDDLFNAVKVSLKCHKSNNLLNFLTREECGALDMGVSLIMSDNTFSSRISWILLA